MVKSVSQTMEELRQELALWKRKVERLKTEGRSSEIAGIERWITDAEAALARWDAAGQFSTPAPKT